MKNLIIIWIFLFTLVDCNFKNENNKSYFFIEKMSLKLKKNSFHEPFVSWSNDSVLTVIDSAYHTFYRFKINNRIKFLVESDILMDSTYFIEYLDNYSIRSDSNPEKEQKLLGASIDGKIDKWENGYNLKFCIVKKSFNNVNDYYKFKGHLVRAIKDWEGLCNIRFTYLENYDNNFLLEPNKNLDFVVRYRDNSELLATAFFPYQVKSDRVLYVGGKYFSDYTYDLTGLMRHEIGHILGFRHEHFRNNEIKQCSGQYRTNTILSTPIPRSKYDTLSVMHLLCNGLGNANLSFTKFDSLGAVEAYGKPIN